LLDQERIHAQCLSDDPEERIYALMELGKLFSYIQNKQHAWIDLQNLTKDEDDNVRSIAIYTLGLVFSHMPDKQQAWSNLQSLIKHEDSNVRSIAVLALGSAFSHVPDKQQAWNDLHRLTNDENNYVRSGAAAALGSAFSHVSDKQQAWNDLHRLTTDKDSNIRSRTALALGYAFSYVPDKQQAWNDLHRLTTDENNYVRSNAAYTVGYVFYQVLDKQQAWNDLHTLTNDQESSVRLSAAYALDSVFSYISDKQQAWNDLHTLTNDENIDVRGSTASVLGSAFSHVPDKQQAWNDLHRLTNDQEINVRLRAASALGSAFSHVPDKQQAWNDLHRLINDENSHIRTYANHSIGKVSIFKASQSENEEEYKRELETAIAFFEKAAVGSTDERSNPAQFCFPFYRSFHTIIFNKQNAKEEVDKYLEEAKKAIEGSESKKQLFEAVKNLAEALREVQNLGNLDFQDMKSELNFYRKYCDRTSEIIRCTEEKAPFATAVLCRGLPIFDKNLKKLLEEIQEKAKTACKESQGTATREIACTVNKEVQKWEINSQEEMSWYVNNIVVVLKSKIPRNTENKGILDMIEHLKFEKDLAKQYRTLSIVIGLIPTVNVVPKQEFDRINSKMDYISDKSDLIYAETIRINAKLDDISLAIFRKKLNPYNVVSNLDAIKKELEKLNGIESLNKSILDKLNSTQAKQLNDLNSNIQDRLNDIEDLIDNLQKNDDFKEVLDRMNELKQSNLEILLQRSSGITSLISFFVMFVQLYQQNIC